MGDYQKAVEALHTALELFNKLSVEECVMVDYAGVYAAMGKICEDWEKYGTSLYYLKYSKILITHLFI